MTGGGHTGRPVDFDSDVISIAFGSFPNVEAHSDSWIHPFGPFRPRHGELRFDGGGQRFQRAGEDYEERVALGPDLGAAMRFERLAEEAAMLIEDAFIVIREVLGEAGGALDVGE